MEPDIDLRLIVGKNKVKNHTIFNLSNMADAKSNKKQKKISIKLKTKLINISLR